MRVRSSFTFSSIFHSDFFIDSVIGDPRHAVSLFAEFASSEKGDRVFCGRPEESLDLWF